MTEFYASKVHHNVKVPDAKVRSAKFANPWMPSGTSYAVRSGKDNGVVDQRLSRPATKPEADNLHPLPGNQNWYNHKPGGDFVEQPKGKAFEIRRPAFNASDKEPVYPEAESIADLNKRRGVGNWAIDRPSLKAPDIMPRQFFTFTSDEASASAISTVKLDESTLKQLFDVKLPDPTDTQWLDEKARLIALYQARGMNADQIKRELDVNKPLGREQRQVDAKRNIGQSELSMTSKLNELREEIKDGRAASVAQQAALMGQFAAVLHDTNAINALTQAQLTNLSVDLARLNVPRNYKAVGLPHRYIDNFEYKANMGLVNMYLMSQAIHYPGLDAGSPIYNGNLVADPVTGLLPSYPFSQILLALGLAGKSKNFIDLQDKILIKKAELLARVAKNPGGWADPDFAGIDPANR